MSSTDEADIPRRGLGVRTAEDCVVLSWRRQAMRFHWLLALTLLGVIQALTAAAVVGVFVLHPGDAAAAAFAVAWATLSLASLYCVFACWLNRTTIWFDATIVRVDRGPLPWFGAIAIPKADVSSVENRVAGWTTFGIEHTLLLHLRDGTATTLLHHATPQIARQVELAADAWVRQAAYTKDHSG